MRPNFFVDDLRVARKAHQCSECGDPIPRGDRYHAMKGKWDGEIDSFAICERCEELRAWLQKQPEACDCIAIGGLEEAIREYAEAIEDEQAAAERLRRWRPISSVVSG